MLPSRIAFIDLETTGASPGHDRITEIGIVEVDGEAVSRWSTLVNPQRSIPEFIQRMTGISNDMVSSAPRFEAVADELKKRLKGRLFVAHNARFDYGFVRQEFRRMGIGFQSDVLCTVRLSRALFPEHPKHSLVHAKTVIEAWRREYNEERPKKSLGGLTPSAYARQMAGRSATLTPGL